MSAQKRTPLQEQILMELLQEVAGIHDFPTEGAYNVRVNGRSIGAFSSECVKIEFKEDGTGMQVHISSHAAGETVHIPVIVSQSGLHDIVRNDFYIEDDADVTIIAGCGIHNDGHVRSQHDGVHVFHLGKRANVRYEEKHYGSGKGTGERVLNPVTEVYLSDDSRLEMDTVQIGGVDSTKRVTKAVLGASSSLAVREKLMTDGIQIAETEFEVELNGTGSSANIISRSVAKGASRQIFLSKINGNAECAGHTECDAIIMDNASVKAIPEITANHVDAALIHEAAIGKIAGEQITKLMTLGLSEKEAEARIVEGFLK